MEQSSRNSSYVIGSWFLDSDFKLVWMLDGCWRLEWGREHQRRSDDLRFARACSFRGDRDVCVFRPGKTEYGYGIVIHSIVIQSKIE